MSDKKVFCKDCANFRSPVGCEFEVQCFDYVNGKNWSIVSQFAFQANRMGDCQDYMPSLWKRIKIALRLSK